jgi:tetratricopeptide (TPR) repeat protein
VYSDLDGKRTAKPHTAGRTVMCLGLLPILLLSVGLAPSASDTWLIETRALIANQKLAQAEQAIVIRMMTEPRDPELITLLAEVRLDQARYGEALSLLDSANQLGGDSALRAGLTGLAQSAAGRMDLAEAQFRKAIQLDPHYAAGHYFLARVLYTDNHFDEAIEESKKAIALSQGLVRAYENLGLCYEGKQQTEEAERWYLEAIDRQSESGAQTEWPMLDLATLLIKLNEPARAKPQLLHALQINPANPQAVYEMGVLEGNLGDFRGAQEEYQKAIQLAPRRANAYYRLARIYEKLGNAAEAKKDFAIFQQISEMDHGARNEPSGTAIK